MVRLRHWQRGFTDLVSVGVGLAILAIVFAGTAGSFIYGRATLAREEHFKVVAHLLRGKMEEVQSAMQLVDDARNPYSPRNLLRRQTYPPVMIERNDRRDKPIAVTIERLPVDTVNLAETGGVLDYYVLTMRATWREHDLAVDASVRPGKMDSLIFITAFVARGIL